MTLYLVFFCFGKTDGAGDGGPAERHAGPVGLCVARGAAADALPGGVARTAAGGRRDAGVAGGPARPQVSHLRAHGPEGHAAPPHPAHPLRRPRRQDPQRASSSSFQSLFPRSSINNLRLFLKPSSFLLARSSSEFFQFPRGIC